MNPARSWLLLGVAVCAILMIVGIVVYWTAPPVGFGWFAYSPTPDGFTVSSSPAHSAQQLMGVILVALGLAGASLTAGYVLGRRTGSRRA